MASWNTEYYKLKEFKKTVNVGRSLWPSPSPSPLKQIVRPSSERWPPCSWRKGTSLSLKTKWHLEESKQTGLANFFPVNYTELILLNLSYSSETVHSIRASINALRSACFLGLCFIMTPPVTWKIHVTYNLYAFLPLLFLSV